MPDAFFYLNLTGIAAVPVKDHDLKIQLFGKLFIFFSQILQCFIKCCFSYRFFKIIFKFWLNNLIISEFVAEKGITRGATNGVPSYGKFKADKFSYLNITSIGEDLVERNTFFAFACLETHSCFSFNLAAFPDINGKFLCELLQSDKYSNSDKLVPIKFFHHYSIAVCEFKFLIK